MGDWYENKFPESVIPARGGNPGSVSFRLPPSPLHHCGVGGPERSRRVPSRIISKAIQFTWFGAYGNLFHPDR